jgi:regulator of protease activity HflC (stomatin/prohibitin superfamily)
MIAEKKLRPMSGWSMLVACLVLLGLVPVLFIGGAAAESLMMVFPAFGCLVGLILLVFGFQAVQPNDARALLLFGEYQGSIVESGFFWVNPFYSKKRISLRVRNFETGSITTPGVTDAAGKVLTHKTHSAGRPSKVNDRDGNPVDISAVVVWRVVAARRTIVDGAVGMVQMALEHLAKDNVVQLDDERRAAMVSNLLVVLCGDRHTQPVINTGTMYH